MTTTFLTSDLHLGHAGILAFKDKNGHPLRPFTDLEEMHSTIITNWNSIVKPQDKVYVLGDVVIKRWAFNVLEGLNGDKVLIKGNHDIFKLKDYLPYFRDVRAYSLLDRAFLSHIPIHPDSLSRWRANIHGHTHCNFMMTPFGKPDPRYINVCVEQTNYTPIAWDAVRASILSE